MKANMGGVDRLIRGAIGIAIIVWGYVAESWWGALGVIPLGTALFSWCPGYVPFGHSTRKQG